MHIETTDGKEFDFQVVGIIEDDETNGEYAVAFSEEADEFIVMDAEGKLLEDDELAQEILEQFLVFAEESGTEET